MTKMNASRYWFLTVVVIAALLSRCVVAEAASPEEVVRSYVLADLGGERLSFKEGSVTRTSVTWEHEPGWDITFVANGLEGISPREERGSIADVEVKFAILGIFSGESLVDVQFHEVVTFTLEKKSGDWEISGPIIPPHVKPQVLSRHLRQLAKEESGQEGGRSKLLIHLADGVDALSGEK